MNSSEYFNNFTEPFLPLIRKYLKNNCGVCACGVCACGVCACGVCACGVCACGVCACGVCACGVCACGVCACEEFSHQTRKRTLR